MWLQARMYFLVVVMFGILYALMVMVSSLLGIGNFIYYAVLAVVMVLIQYLVGPLLVGLTMRVRWATEQEEPELHRAVAELAEQAKIPKPKVGISQLPFPNAFAYGRSQRDARVVVTQGLQKLLSPDELKAVLGHEISHVKHRDMAILTLLSVVPLILWYLARGLLWGGSGQSRKGAGYLALLGVFAFALYFAANLLVLYASRIREYYADLGSVRLGTRPRYLATALYKLVYGNANAPKEELRRIEGHKAFFVTDPSRSLYELRELKEIDKDLSGSIDSYELSLVRGKEVKLDLGDRLIELVSTHPNMLKRIKHLSSVMFDPHE